MKFSINDFFSKCEQIRNFLRIWSHLLKKSLMENFIFCAVKVMMRDELHLEATYLTPIFPPKYLIGKSYTKQIFKCFKILKQILLQKWEKLTVLIVNPHLNLQELVLLYHQIQPKVWIVFKFCF